MTGGDDLADGTGDDLRRGVVPPVRLAAHGSGHVSDLVGVGTALGRGLQVVGGDRRPLGADAIGGQSLETVSGGGRDLVVGG